MPVLYLLLADKKKQKYIEDYIKCSHRCQEQFPSWKERNWESLLPFSVKSHCGSICAQKIYFVFFMMLPTFQCFHWLWPTMDTIVFCFLGFFYGLVWSFGWSWQLTVMFITPRLKKNNTEESVSSPTPLLPLELITENGRRLDFIKLCCLGFNVQYN